MLPFSPDIAFRVNLLSPLSSALSVMFLYLIIVKVVINWRGEMLQKIDVLIAFGGAAIGSSFCFHR